MTPDEVAEFESRDGALDAVRIRRWDEQAKVVGAQTPPLGHFLPSLRRVML
jgi:gamma-butyrobetaine dioxygenase